MLRDGCEELIVAVESGRSGGLSGSAQENVLLLLIWAKRRSDEMCELL